MKLFLRTRKISWKITIIYTAMFIIVLFALNSAVFLGLRYFVINNAKKNIVNNLDFILLKVNKLSHESVDIYETDVLQEISQSERNIYYRILSPTRNVIVQSGILEGMDIPVQEGYKDLQKGERSFIYKNSKIIRNGIFIGYLQVIRDVTLEYQFLKLLLSGLLFTSGLGVIIAIFVGFTITRKTLQPINLITNTARTISGTDLGQRLEIPDYEDELTHLARTFNSMLDRLERSFRRQQQFVSDASHELRTPISVIQGYIDLLDRWGKDEVEVRDEAIQAIQKEVVNMNSLVESLLFLARGDSEKIQLNKRNFRVDLLITELLKESSMLTSAINVTSSKNEKVIFFGDREMIKQMLRIFIDNSFKYTPEGGHVSINSFQKDNQLVLSVSDTGIGIPEEDIPHIFNRFYRVDKARSTKQGGTGLGLAIARLIIEHHQGHVEVKSQLSQGTVVKVFFPLQQINRDNKLAISNK